MIALLLSMFAAIAQDEAPEDETLEDETLEEVALEDTGAPEEEDEDEDDTGLDEDEEDDEDDDAPVTAVRAQRAKVETPFGGVRMIPLRMDIGTALREDVLPAFVFGIGAQLIRSKRFALEANGVVMPMHTLQYVGPWRSMMNWDASADLTYLASRFFSVGPAAGVQYRLFNQQGSSISRMFVPVAGVRANATFLWARTWSLAITARVTSDLALTRLVFETQQTQILPPVETQIALRLNMGHGKPAGEQR